VKIRDWIKMLTDMEPDLEARVMYESAAAIVINAWPAPPPSGPGPTEESIAVLKTPETDLPDPIQVLRDLFEAGGLEDHFYAVRESEGEGWEGPRMVKWGNACEAAKKLMKS